MGLDMYLKAKRFLWGGGYDHPDNEVSEKISAAMGGTPGRVQSVECEVGYWRKANHIHRWFVDNCQDGVDECQKTDVSKEKLTELLELCKKVMSEARLVPGKIHVSTSWTPEGKVKNYEDGMVVENAEVLHALLPTQEGFFFGGTEYDQWYLTDVETTIEILEKALQLPNDWSISYWSSW